LALTDVLRSSTVISRCAFKGITEAQHIRLAGQGLRPPQGGAAGDIFLAVSFAPHPIYRAQGKGIFMNLPVAPWEAALGDKELLPTPGGKVDLSIPPNARSGQKLRPSGKALPDHSAGDLYTNVVNVNPRVTTSEARDIFAQMARKIPFDPHEELERASS
jgi:curved DNA-binding protein